MKNLSLVFISFLLFACGQSSDQNITITENEAIKTQRSTQDVAEKPTDETGFIHTVFFWFNDDVTEAQSLAFQNDGLKKLLEIESIYKGYIGPPASTSRGVIDNSYDFALVCHFKNAKDEESYQKDPVHLKFIEDFKDLWEKVKVYDNLVMD